MIEPYLAKLIDEEWGHVQKAAQGGFKVCSRIRPPWNEDVLEEHEAWREYSMALRAANERSIIQGRPGLKLVVGEQQPFEIGPLREVGGAFIEQALDTLIPAYPSSKVWRMAMDGKYYLVQPDDFAKIVGWDWTDRRTYLAEKFDCEDFSALFRGTFNDVWHSNCVGMVIDWSSFHAYNVVVLADGKAVLYEPQDDSIPLPGTGIHKLTEGCILI